MLTQENADDIERVQKSALKVILKEDYITYEDAMEKLMLATLSDRRKKLCLKFAKNCAKNELTSDLFPLNLAGLNTRGKLKYLVTHANTDRYKDSPVPYLQRLLNENWNTTLDQLTPGLEDPTWFLWPAKHKRSESKL